MAGGGLAQARRTFYAVALEGSVITPLFAKGVVSVSLVTDLAGSGGVLWSFGGAGGAKEPKGVEVGLTVLFFPNALLEDFAGLQTLGTQIDLGLGEPQPSSSGSSARCSGASPRRFSLRVDAGARVLLRSGQARDDPPARLRSRAELDAVQEILGQEAAECWWRGRRRRRREAHGPRDRGR